MQLTFSLRQPNGYTLIELIFVIVIIGILAAIAVPTWNASQVSVESEAGRILSDVRYTQMMSVATGERYRWVRVSGNSYSILNESGTPVVLPSGGTVATLTGGVVFGSFSNLPNNLVAFNSLGVPYIDTSLPGTALSSAGGIVLSGGGLNRTVYVVPQTGYGGLS